MHDEVVTLCHAFTFLSHNKWQFIEHPFGFYHWGSFLSKSIYFSKVYLRELVKDSQNHFKNS